MDDHGCVRRRGGAVHCVLRAEWTSERSSLASAEVVPGVEWGFGEARWDEKQGMERVFLLCPHPPTSTPAV